MSKSKDKFGEGYFRERTRFPTAVFKGKDLSLLKFPFWDRHIRRYKREGTLLDVGCAEGTLLKWTAKRGYQSYGLDISGVALSIAKQRLKRCEMVIGNLRSLPFEDNCFDVITCFDVLEHLEQPSAGLEQISRCLKENGLFTMSVPNISSRGLKWKGDRWFGYRDVTHVSLFSAKQWNELLQESGFKVIDTFYDTLWDTPYFERIPTCLQHALFKPFLLLFYWTPIRFPAKCGENLYLVATKKA